MQLEMIKEQRQQASKAQVQLAKRVERMGAVRLALMLLALLGVIGGVKEGQGIYYIVALIALVVFVVFLFKHQAIKNQAVYMQEVEQVLARYEARFDNEWKSFPDDGAQFLQADELIGADLDIFGAASLYQYLSVAHTLHGQQALVAALRLPEYTPQQLRERQEAVQELAENWQLAVQFEALSASALGGKGHLTMEAVEKFLKYGERSGDELPRWHYLLSWILPVVTLGGLILAALHVIPGFVPAVCIAAQIGISMLSYGQVMAVLEPLFSLHHSISAYQGLFRQLEQTSFRSVYLQKLHDKLSHESGAAKGIAELHNIGEAVNLRYNVLLYWPACGLLMWNSHCVSALARWKARYGRQMRQWMEAVGEFESLLSLAVLCQVKENWCLPEIVEDKPVIFHGEDIRHPLLIEGQAVANSVGLRAQTCVITGSNMSGKTTFLRSIGVNLVLAYAGGAVCAQRLETSMMRLFTSIRVHDDISQGISTFYAELLRIKQMVQYGKKRQPMLVLIDEIFKGTNSADRLVGAKAVISQLAKPWCITLVSTHDFELCDLEKDQTVRAVNYHFSEYYVGDEIRFDYLMRSGRCQTTNAQQLMRMAGLL